MSSDKALDQPLATASGREVFVPRIISTEQLLGKDQEVAIDHGGTLYRLRITRQGKLILTK